MLTPITTIRMPVITIRQPWAWLILQQHDSAFRKDIENRNWKIPPQYIDTPVLIHTSAKPDCQLSEVLEELDCEGHDDTVNCIIAALRAGLGKADYARRGHIVGVVRFSKSIKNPAFDMNADAQTHVNAASLWANSDSHFWWKIEKAKPITPVSAKGQLSFWKFDYPHPEELEGF